MIVITINFQGNFPTVVMDDDLERPRRFNSFDEAMLFIDEMSDGYRAACASICIVDINTGETETV